MQKRILAHIFATVTLQKTRSTSGNKYTVDRIVRELEREEEKSIKRAIRDLYTAKLVRLTENSDGSTTIEFTDKGELYARTFNLDEMRLPKQKRWDGQWRLVLVDIPEKRRGARDAFRVHLTDLGFEQLQKSVWVYPYECKSEVDFLIEYYEVRPFARYGKLTQIDNDLDLRDKFDLL